MKRRRLHNCAGFTLVELLVAVAIFVALMAGVMLLFTSAVRTVRQAEQTREAFDLARGAMRVLQDDLVSAYSARERGDVFQFYGTPIGMTFIAFIETEERIPQLARITYVLHHSDLLPAREIVLPTGAFDENGDEIYETQWLVPLLRYVEPEIADLESFPVEWSGKVNEAAEGGPTYNDVIAEVVQRRMAELRYVSGDERLRERVERVTRRQLWIEMLAGQTGTFWESEGKDPRDYVVLDNVLTRKWPLLPGDGDLAAIEQPVDVPYQLDPNRDGYLYTSSYPNVFFQYGIADRYEADDNPDRRYMARWTTYWQDYVNMRQLPGTTPGKPVALAPGLDTRVEVGSPLFPRLPEMVRTLFSLYFESPYVGVPPFLRQFEQEVTLRSGYTRQNIKEL